MSGTPSTQTPNPAVKNKSPFKRVSTPTMLQMEAVECGAAALGMILAYHGRYVSLEELRSVCGISRDGSRASNLVKAARFYGLEAKGFKRQPQSLLDMPLPMILFWELNHFVVLEGFSKTKVYINDPASGPAEISWSDFDQSYTGVVLTFEPGPEFQPGGSRPSVIAGLRKRLSGSEIAIVYVVLVGLAFVIPGLIVPTFTRVFVDSYLVAGLDSWVMPLLIGMGFTAIITALLTWLQQYFLLRQRTKMALVTTSQFFWHVLRLPIEFFNQRFGGEISSRIATNNYIAQLVSGEIATTIINCFMVVFFTLLMLQYDVLLTIIGIGIALLNIFALRFVSRRRGDANQRLLQEQGKLMGTAMSGLQIIETLKASGGESDFFNRWAGQQAVVMNAEQNFQRSSQVIAVLPGLLGAVNTAAILVIGGLRIMDGVLTIGMLVAFQSLMETFLDPFNQLVGLGSTLQEVEGDMERLDDVFRYPIDSHTQNDTTDEESTTRKLSGHVVIRDLTFGYSRLEAPLVENFNLTLKPGTRVALIGGSGSGKSTIARLVAGLYEPWSGEILFDGVPRKALPRRVITNSLAMVDQDIFLFEGTVRENLTMWDTLIPDPVLVHAAKDAGLHEEIITKNAGYDYQVAEGGRNLSGGQRQRMEITRALVGNPTILVLDEATSALDTRTEQLIDDRLRRRGCTCIIVAHRLSTIRDCDEIIILDHGKVVQRGTHEDMIQDLDGHYAKLIEADIPKHTEASMEYLY